MLGDYSTTWVLHLALWGYFMLEVLAWRPAVCRTNECMHAADKVLYSMDRHTNPCNDFYRFACGNYLDNVKLPEGQAHNSTFIRIYNKVTKKRFLLMENSSRLPDEPKQFQMVRDFYNMCLRRDLIEMRGVGFLLDLFKKAGGWPVLEGSNWDGDNFDWVENIYKLHELGLSGELFEINVSTDRLDSFKKVIEVDEVSFGLQKGYLLQGRGHALVEEYRSFMEHIAQMLVAKPYLPVRELSLSLDFEIELANITASVDERRQISGVHNPMKIQTLQRKYPIVDWIAYISKITNNNIKLSPDYVVNVRATKFLRGLESLLKKTSKRTLANYLMWKSVSKIIPLMTMGMRNRQLFFINRGYTIPTYHPSRTMECLEIASNSMALAVSSMYVRNYFKEDAKSAAVELVENIQQEMLKRLKTVEWMDEKTRSLAIEKCLALQKHIGYPSELLDNKKIEEHYKRLVLTGDKYFESVVNLTTFTWNVTLDMLKQNINKSDWRTHGSATITNAIYNPVENSINVPAAILQDVFFSHKLPRYMNYGAIGTVIAHELTHGYDLVGLQFDKKGRIRIWWSSFTRRSFRSKTKCVIEQADNYTVKVGNEKLTLNGLNIQVENTAESGGIKLSYSAYNSWAKKNKREPRLLGMEKYTPQQMFWLSAANAWCTAYRDETLRDEITKGYHPPAEYRVNNAMRNQEAFAKDFKCPVGSKMNPAKKCNVW